MLRRCSRCILPETYPGIRFDDEQVCNYCHSHKGKRVRGKAALEALVERYRTGQAPGAGLGRYDCIVSLSGGRDSSFAAHYAARVLDLKALLFTFDNGLMPDQTRENIRNTASVLGADLVTLKSAQVRQDAGYLLRCWTHRPSPAMVGLLCSGCMAGIKSGLDKTVHEYQVPLVITGSGEPKSRTSFAQEMLGPVQSGKKRALASGFAREVINNPRYVCNPRFVIGLGRDFFYRFVHRRKKTTRSISIFGFIEWDETELLITIQNELGWKKPAYSASSWRADCLISELKNYLYLHTLGFTKHDEQLSGMIRQGLITREEALHRLETDNVISDEVISELCLTLDVDWRRLQAALAA